MASWGAGLIEDDLATDFVGQIVELDSIATVGRALRAATRAPGHLLYEAAVCALIAAEAVAALDGRPAARLPSELARWASAGRAGGAVVELRPLAISAVERVKEDSELAELWARSDQLARWVESIDDLLGRLERAAR